MNMFLNKLMLRASLFALVGLALMCAGCASAPPPQEQLRQAVIQRCAVVDGIMPFDAPFDRCDAIKARLAEKASTAPVGQQEELVACILPGGERATLSYGECRKKAGVFFNSEDVAAKNQNTSFQEPVVVAQQIRPRVVVRNNDCDPSGWFCGAPPPRPYIGSPFYSSGASSAYTYTRVNVGHSARYGTYWNIHTQSYQRW